MISLGLEDYRPAQRKVEQRAILYSDFAALGLVDAPSTSGVVVNERSAYGHPAFWNGVNVISSQIATLPRAVYKRLGDDDRERDHSTPGARVLAQPNPNTTDVVFWETLMAHALTWGNAYAEIELDRAGRPLGLWPITPDVMRPVMEDGRLCYSYRNGRETLEAAEVFHVPGLGFDGLQGYSVVHMLRESLAQGMAVKRFGASFFGNGAWPGIMLEHPGAISDQELKHLASQHDGDHRGPGHAHRTKILEMGMTANKIGIPPEDAQFLQTQEFDVEEVARILNINPAKLKSKVGERPGGNFETVQIEFLTDTLRPWLIRIEQEANRKLFPVAARATYYVEHLVDALLRVDSAGRAASYKAYWDMGVLSAEQIAKKENLPKPAPKPEPVPAAVPTVPEQNERMAAAQRALVIEAVSRFVRRETERVRRATKRGAGGLDAWLDEFYEGEVRILRGYLLGPVRIAMASRGIEGDPDHVAGQLADGYVSRSRGELLALPARNIEEAAERLMAGWETSRPIDLAEKVAAMRGERVQA